MTGDADVSNAPLMLSILGTSGTGRALHCPHFPATFQPPLSSIGVPTTGWGSSGNILVDKFGLLILREATVWSVSSCCTIVDNRSLFR